MQACLSEEVAGVAYVIICIKRKTFFAETKKKKIFDKCFFRLWLYFVPSILELISEETLNESVSIVIR